MPHQTWLASQELPSTLIPHSSLANYTPRSHLGRRPCRNHFWHWIIHESFEIPNLMLNYESCLCTGQENPKTTQTHTMQRVFQTHVPKKTLRAGSRHHCVLFRAHSYMQHQMLQWNTSRGATHQGSGEHTASKRVLHYCDNCFRDTWVCERLSSLCTKLRQTSQRTYLHKNKGTERRILTENFAGEFFTLLCKHEKFAPKIRP